MKELKELAAEYAEKKVNEIVSKAIAEIYTDGYCDGYKAHEEDISVNLRDSAEFVDLGLPSGTLWSKDYVIENRSILYVPYIDAIKYPIPTKEQLQELYEECRWSLYENGDRHKYCYICIGPNGNNIKFNFCGFKKMDSVSDEYWNVHFWIKSQNSNGEIDFAHLRHIGAAALKDEKGIDKIFSGFKLPIRLVSKK